MNGGLARPGRLDLVADRLTLSGGSRVEPRLHEIPVDDVADVRIGRRPDERIGGRTTLVLELRDGRVVSVVGFSPVGAVHEVAERLWALIGDRAAPPAGANGLAG